jgi:hypothetical protein
MKRILTLACAVGLVALVAGCGGGGGIFSPGLHGAIATHLDNDCDGYAAGLAANASSEGSAVRGAINQCINAGGYNCEVLLTFGSAYLGNVDCGALAYGEYSDGYTLSCALQPGSGGSQSSAEVDALSDCRNDGYYCVLVTSLGGGRFATCSG